MNAGRKQKVEEIMSGFQRLRRAFAVHGGNGRNMPRITPSQWGVLMYLEYRGESTLKELAAAMQISSSAATQLVDSLVKSRCVKRAQSAHDRRSITLSLAPRTKKQVTAMKKEAMLKFVHMFDVLSDREFDQYCQLSKKIVERLSKHAK